LLVAPSSWHFPPPEDHWASQKLTEEKLAKEKLAEEKLAEEKLAKGERLSDKY